MEIKKKFLPIIVVSFFTFLMVLFSIYLKIKKNFSRQSNSKKEVANIKKTLILKNIKVNLKKIKGKDNTINLTIDNIPEGTDSIEYELTYETKDKGLQGVIGTVDDLKGGQYKKEVYLGTCSSGSCVPHKVMGELNLILKFKGSYGEEIFENNYKL